MRKFILITAFVLVSASAQAGITRSLTLASSDQPSATAEQSEAAQAPKSAARQRPSIRQQSSQNPQQNSQKLQQGQKMRQGGQRMQRPGPITAAKYAVAVKVEKLKRQGASTLARVKYALYRHGIYW